MASKALNLGEFSFKSKKEARELYTSILYQCKLGSPLEGDSHDYVMALLINHPRAAEKIGSGVDYLKVDIAHGKAGRCFHVVRKDGTSDNFSLGKCINGDHSVFHKFCLACRMAVKDEVNKFKREYIEENTDAEDGLIKCQSSGDRILPGDASVDHREPLTFSTIAHFFVQAKNIDLSSVSYVTEGKFGNVFSDQNIVNDFKAWHKKNARLRVISSKYNLRKAHLGRISQTKADGVL